VLESRMRRRGLRLEPDENEARSREMRAAYEEMMSGNGPPRLTGTVWHRLDATRSLADVEAAAWNILIGILPELGIPECQSDLGRSSIR
jgi:thymidylate kinase